MHAIEGSGSDIVSGGVLRYDGAHTRPSGLHRRAIPETRIATHVRAMPSLLYDTTAWNKIFRRQFLLDHGLRFPEGVYYEDIPLTVPAHFLARSVDLIQEPGLPVARAPDGRAVDHPAPRREPQPRRPDGRGLVGQRLPRAHGRGRGQAPARPQGAHPRHAPLPRRPPRGRRGVRRHPRARCSARTSRTSTLPSSRACRPGAAWRTTSSPPAAPPSSSRPTSCSCATPSRRSCAGVCACSCDLPYFGDAAVGVPDAVYDVTRSQSLVTGIRDVRWNRATLRGRRPRLHRRRARRRARHDAAPAPAAPRRFQGRAPHGPGPPGASRRRHRSVEEARRQLRRLRLPRPRPGGRPRPARGQGRRRVRARGPGGRPRGPTWVRRRQPRVLTGTSPTAGLGARRRHRRAGLPRQEDADRRPPRRWSSSATWRSTARTWCSACAPLPAGSCPTPTSTCAGSTPPRASPCASSATVPRASPGSPPRPSTSRRGRSPSASGASGSPPPATTTRPTPRSSSTGSSPRPPTAEREAPRALTVTGRHVGPLDVDPEPGPGRARLHGRLVQLRERGVTGAMLVDGPFRPELTDFVFTSAGLELHGDTGGIDLDRLVLLSSADRLELPVEISGDSWRALVPATGAAGAAPRCGGCARAGGRSSRRPRVRPTPSSAVHVVGRGRGAPRATRAETRSPSSCVHRPRTSSASSPTAAAPGGTVGPFNQTIARKVHYRVARRLPLTDTVFFEAWKGRQYSDNPRAIHEELVRRGDERRLVWAVEHHGVEVPDGVETVVVGSRAYYRALGRARWVVSNDSMPKYYAKREGSRLRPDVARHPAQADRLRHREPPDGEQELPHAVRQGGRQVGRPGVPERVLHRDLPPGLPLRRPGPRDRVPPQRRLPPARGAGGAHRRRCGAARHRAGEAGHPLRPDVARQPVRQGGPLPVLDEARPRADVPAVQGRRRAPHPRAPAGRRQRRHLDVRWLRPQRVALPRHQRPLPRRRRARHRLLLGDVRLRQHRSPDAVLHPRPRGLPRRPARLLHRLRGRGPGAAAHATRPRSSTPSPTSTGWRPTTPSATRRSARSSPPSRTGGPPPGSSTSSSRTARDAQQVVLPPELPQPVALTRVPVRRRAARRTRARSR